MALLIRNVFRAALLLLFVAGTPVSANADENIRLHEQEIKAGLLYNFLKYIDWPSVNTSAAVVVCIFGDDPFNGYLQPMAGRTVNQHEITVRNIHDVQEIGTCNLLFVNASEKDRWPQLSKSLIGKSVLTVSDFDDFVKDGGMVEFGRKDDHISVLLNMDAVIAAQLRVQDRLLKLVAIAHPDLPETGR